MLTKILQLTIGSRDLSQAEKMLLLQDEQHKRMIIFFNQDIFMWIFSAKLEINHVIQQPIKAN